MRTTLLTVVVVVMSSCGQPAVPPPPPPPVDLVMSSGCSDDSQCSAPTPRCNLNSKKCVACLPENDNCPKGQRCIPSNGSFACSSACISDADCPRSDAGTITACCNGACVDTKSDTQSCGRCGNNCLAPPHATPGCSNGACGIGTCNLGFLDCDQGASNGCEVNASTDARNCGACGKVCTNGANQSADCVNGMCTTTCNPGFADCDGNAANGCEVDTRSDDLNCGACKAACALPNAASRCRAGACAIDSCTKGFEDCNQMAKDGCESDLGQDVTHCGNCLNACAAPNGVPACRSGTCGIASCNMGFADCDSLVPNGCEVPTLADAKNCGVCGNKCLGNNSMQACQMGACQITMCTQDYSDCDKKPGTGCEVNVANDPVNCGGCGMACPIPTNATASCANGMCGVGQCKFGFADCNKDPKDGCEVDLLTVQNCGVCGNGCMAPPNATPACKAGQCGVGMCNALFGDCDGIPGNGCEKNLGNDANNCGKCGAACNFANGQGACLGGQCGLFACNQGFANCNMQAMDGCEVNLSTDANNCAACGKVCPNGNVCLGGVCQAYRANVLVCGTTGRQPNVFFPQGMNFVTMSSCVPDNSTQALFITRNWNPISAQTLQAYLNGGGIILTEYSISQVPYNLAFGTNAVQGVRVGGCDDTIPCNVQFSPNDPFWMANQFQARGNGCGYAVEGYPGITPICGWNANNVSVGYRDLGSGRFWATEFDWQDNQQFNDNNNTVNLMGYMMTHRR